MFRSSYRISPIRFNPIKFNSNISLNRHCHFSLHIRTRSATFSHSPIKMSVPGSTYSIPSNVKLIPPPYSVVFPPLPSSDSRLLIIGDVHGCLEELVELVSLALPNRTSSDRIILVGDLLAKGPHSSDLLEFVRSIGASSVLGNHEQRILKAAHQTGRIQELMEKKISELKSQETANNEPIELIDYLHYATADVGPFPPVSEKSQHFSLAAALSDSDLLYLASLPLQILIPQFNSAVIHAGVETAKPLDQQQPKHLVNIRNVDADGVEWTRPQTAAAAVAAADADSASAASPLKSKFPWASRWSGPEFLIFGHDAIRELQQHQFALGLDTGCCYGKRLTGVLLPGRQLFSVPARKIYEIPRGNVNL